MLYGAQRRKREAGGTEGGTKIPPHSQPAVQRRKAEPIRFPVQRRKREAGDTEGAREKTEVATRTPDSSLSSGERSETTEVATGTPGSSLS